MADTIFALATSAGRAAVAIIRISGPCARTALEALAGACPVPRRATLASLRDPRDAHLLDRALLLWFPAPASFTGEDCAEVQVHGGRAVVAAVLSALAALPGCRLAEAGEFTRRALLNDKLDLAAVEGLADLIDAQTEAQRRQALRQLEGALNRWVSAQRAALLGALAAAESAIDFSDEGDVAGDLLGEVRHAVRAIHRAVAEQLAWADAAERVRDGFVVALTGPPNAGKSTLLNALARREAAIVSPYPGTTRDPVEVQLDLDGQLVVLIDTAGLRDTLDPVEREGIVRSLARARAADVALWLQEAGGPPAPDPAVEARRVWAVATKTDLHPADAGFDHALSAQTGEGIAGLLAAIRRLADQEGGQAGTAVVTRLRHRRALEQAERALAALVSEPEGLGVEVMVERIRLVVAHLDSLVGRIEPDEVLGEIFARFCVGK